MEFIDTFIDSKIFSYLEILDPKAAIRWPFVELKEREKLIVQAILAYGKELVHKQCILENLYKELPKIVDIEMDREASKNKK